MLNALLVLNTQKKKIDFEEIYLNFHYFFYLIIFLPRSRRLSFRDVVMINPNGKQN